MRGCLLLAPAQDLGEIFKHVLPEDLLKSIDKTGPNRSAFIERASRAYLARLEKLKREQRDVEIINAHSRRMNAEAMDVISYQSPHNRY